MPSPYRKHFDEEKCAQMIKIFKNYNDGMMEVGELKDVVKDMGHNEITEEQTQVLLSRFSTDGFI